MLPSVMGEWDVLGPIYGFCTIVVYSVTYTRVTDLGIGQSTDFLEKTHQDQSSDPGILLVPHEGDVCLCAV